MFDVGFSELIVIAIVALVVIGPERLPKVARTAGLLLGRLQRYVNDVKADINREMQLDELKALRAEMQDSARDFEQRLHSEIRSVEETVATAAPSADPVPSIADAEVALPPAQAQVPGDSTALSGPKA